MSKAKGQMTHSAAPVASGMRLPRTFQVLAMTIEWCHWGGGLLADTSEQGLQSLIE